MNCVVSIQFNTARRVATLFLTKLVDWGIGQLVNYYIKRCFKDELFNKKKYSSR